MELYVGMDLHSRNTYFGILNEDLKRVFKRRLESFHQSYGWNFEALNPEVPQQLRLV